MQYSPTPAEMAAMQDQLDNLPTTASNMEHPIMELPTSKWGKQHLAALRVVKIDDAPLTRFFNAELIPGDNDPVYDKLARDIAVPTLDDLRANTDELVERNERNLFAELFDHLAKLVTTRPYFGPETEAWERDPSPKSDILASSHEGEDEDGGEGERVSRNCLGSLITRVLRPPVRALGKGLYLGWCVVQQTCVHNFLRTNRLGYPGDSVSSVYVGRSGAAESLTDGFVTVNGFGRFTGSSRLGKYPMVNLEAKRWHAGGIMHSTGEDEKYSPRVLAREVGDMIAQAMVHCNQVYGEGEWRDQEAWAITLHGTELRLVTAQFSGSYLKCVNSLSMPPTEGLVVYRSAPANLKLVEGRLMALKYLLALFAYLRSGAARIALLEEALADANRPDSPA